MAEIPKLIQRQGSGKMTSTERTDSKKMSSENLMSGLNAKSDGFIVDLEAFSTHISAYSRITQLPRSLSRKGHHRGSGDSVTSFLVAAAAAAACSSPSSSSSPKVEMGPSSIQEKAGAGGGGSCSAVGAVPVVITVGVGPTNTIDREPENPNPQPNNNQHHQHQITVKTGGTIIPPAGAAPDTQMGGRRRSHLPWYSHPKRVLLFFATISSIGTLLLICFTLAINKPYTTSD